MNKNKCLEYYLDSRIYNQEDIQKNIEETKKDFSNRDVSVSIKINKFGMYIITFYFTNKNTIFNRIRIYLKRKSQKRLLLKEKNHIERT